MIRQKRYIATRSRRRVRPAGAATLDYILVLGIILPMAALLMWAAPRTMLLVYEMIAVLVSWPFT